MDTQEARRSSDTMRELHIKLDKQEEAARKTDIEVRDIKSQAELTKMEIRHQSEVMNSQFKVLEEKATANGTRLEMIASAIQAMGADANNTPAGRSMMEFVKALEKSHKEAENRLKVVEASVDRVMTVIWLGKWAVGGNFLTLAYLILKAFGKVE